MTSRWMVGHVLEPTQAVQFTPRQVSQMVDDAFSGFRLRISDLPAEPTLGIRQNVPLAALTLSSLEALETAGGERDYAIELTGDTSGASATIASL